MRIAKARDNIQAFKQTFRKHRLKIAPQRVVIFKKLKCLKTHPTADDIYQLVQKDFSNISFDTVNRSLKTFAKVGVVDVIDIFSGAKRFDPDVYDHHHFHCSEGSRSSASV